MTIVCRNIVYISCKGKDIFSPSDHNYMHEFILECNQDWYTYLMISAILLVWLPKLDWYTPSVIWRWVRVGRLKMVLVWYFIWEVVGVYYWDGILIAFLIESW